MAKPSPARCIICRFLLLAALYVATFIPLRTEAQGDLLQLGNDLRLLLLDTGKSVFEIREKKSLFEKATSAMSSGFEARDRVHDKYHQIADAVNGAGGGDTRAVHNISTGKQTFPVVAVDVTNMFTTTTSCDFITPGLRSVRWFITCNSEVCPPQHCAAKNAFCRFGDTTTWALFHETVGLEGATAAQVRHADAWYFCSLSSSESRHAVLGLGLAGALPFEFQRFSYLLGSNGLISVWLGDAPPSRPTATLPLHGTRKNPGRYYVRVKAVLVDGQRLSYSPSDILERGPADDGTGGVYMSSHPVDQLTYLNKDVHDNLVQEFNNRLSPAMSVPTQSEQLCYRDESLASKVIPRLALVFDDDGKTPHGARMDLRKENYWYKTSDGSLQCLAILPSPWKTGESILGSQLQWGWRMTYDLKAGVLQVSHAAAAFAPTATCVATLLLLPFLLHLA